MSRSRTALLALLALAMPLMAAGCGDNDSAGSNGRIAVIATTGIAADITRQIAGNRADVAQLIPDSATPHTFQASAEDRQRIAEADLLVSVGNGLEPTVPADDAARAFALGGHAGALIEADHTPGEEHEGEEPEGGELDPHVWMDPIRVAAALPALASELGSIDAEGAEAYTERARHYASRLRRIDREIDADAAALPSGSRALVTSHEALGYFADRYGFQIVATPFGLSPEAEASAQDVQSVIDAVREHDVAALFVEQGDDPQLLERIADATGARIVDDLLIEGFGAGADSYAELLRFTAGRIVGALEG